MPTPSASRIRCRFGITEPTTGSDTTQIKTRAELDASGTHYVVTGQKVFISRALYSDLTTEIFIDGLRVPVENRIGEEGTGFRYILDGMNAERIIAASEMLGDARWFIKTAAKYASERVVFGRPIGKNQGVQFPIARAYTELVAAEMMVRKATALFAAGAPYGEDANIAKLLASETAWHAGEACLQTHGGFDFATEYDVERKWREVCVTQVAPVSTNLILAHMAEHALGMPRSF